MAPKTREKVLEAARDLGYRVNYLARSLSLQRTNLVGLVVSDMDNSFRAGLIDHLARGLVALDYRPFMLPSNPNDDVTRLIDMMLHYNVSGAIVTSDTSPAEIAQNCAAYGVPLVLVNKAEAGGHVANVSLDSEKAGRLAAEVLKAAGCERVGVASQRRPSHTLAQRKQAFVRRSRELGLVVEADFQGEAQNYSGGLECARALVESGLKLDGVYCINDYLALGFLDYLRHETDIRVPEDLAIIACDDIPEAAWLNYDLTTVRQDPKLLADASITALLGCISAPDAYPVSVHIDVQLVERGTALPSRKFTKDEGLRPS